MAGLRLFPHYHNYQLTSKSSLDMIHRAADNGMVLSIPIRVVDRRQRHWLDSVSDLSISDIGSVMRKCPEASYIILNGHGFHNSELAKDKKLKDRNFLIEISRMGVVLQEEIPKLISVIGPSRLAFGTGIPFKYPMPALLKIQVLNAPEQVKEKIRWENAARMLGLGASCEDR